jgi:hypothetical protein
MEFDKIAFSEPNIKTVNKYKSTHKFYKAHVYKRCVFFVGLSYPAIIKYDTECKKLEYCSDWVDEIDKKSKDGYLLGSSCVADNYIIAVAHNANVFVVFDMDTCISSMYIVGKEDYKYSNICYDGRFIWAFVRAKALIVKWDYRTHKWIEYANFPKGFKQNEPRDVFTTCLNDCIWVFPIERANMPMKINPKDGKIIIADEFINEHTKKDVNSGYLLAKVFNDMIYVHKITTDGFTYESDCFVEFNPKNGDLREDFITVSKGDLNILKQAYIRNSHEGLLTENFITSFDDFFNYIIANDFSVNSGNTIGWSGDKILNGILDYLK